MAQSTQDQGQTQQTNGDVERQLRDIARQGRGMASVAHICAGALLVLFSAASFVALGGDAFTALVSGWQHAHTLDIPSAISLAVITLMVPAFDVGALYAASILRLLASRRAAGREQIIHWGVLIGVALVEAAAYAYMAYRYERPETAIAWAIILARAIAAPLLAVYLSMARPLPVTARDILAQVELASGAGLIRDVVTIAHDSTALIGHKAALYGASAEMLPRERDRLDGLLSVIEAHPPLPAPILPPGSAPATAAKPPDRDRPPTGPGTPAAAPVVPTVDEPDATPVQAPAPDRWNTQAEDPDEAGLRPAATALAPTDLKTALKRAAEASRRAKAFALLDSRPGMPKREFQRQMRVGAKRARELYAAWEYERTRAARSAAR